MTYTGLAFITPAALGGLELVMMLPFLLGAIVVLCAYAAWYLFEERRMADIAFDHAIEAVREDAEMDVCARIGERAHALPDPPTDRALSIATAIPVLCFLIASPLIVWASFTQHEHAVVPYWTVVWPATALLFSCTNLMTTARKALARRCDVLGAQADVTAHTLRLRSTSTVAAFGSSA